MWEIPVEILLTGGIGTLPLAPIAKIGKNQLSTVVRRMKQRLKDEPQPQVGELWMATKILMGLRYTSETTNHLLKGVKGMRESVTYQEIREEGVASGLLEGQHKMLVNVGENRFGTPSPHVVVRIAAISSTDQLAALAKRVWAVETWDELLADVN